jgi:hypothetical protein
MNCKFELGDEVKIIASEERLKELGIPSNLVSAGGIGRIEVVNHSAVLVGALPYRVKIKDDDGSWWYGEEDLELVEESAKLEQPQNSEAKRTFDTGATRDTTQGKLDYVRALSPIVLKRYVEYLDKHRLQPDGSYRDFDNWKRGIPQDVYHSSGGRHFLDTWLITEGYLAEDNHGPVELEDVICAQLFNLQGRLHEILKARGYCMPVDRTKPVPGGY